MMNKEQLMENLLIIMKHNYNLSNICSNLLNNHNSNTNQKSIIIQIFDTTQFKKK